MTVNDQTISFIKSWEKLSLEPYADHKQWSIGYGTFAGPFPGPKPALRLSNERQAHDLLLKDVKTREASIKSRLKKPLNQNQFSALISFAFNAGVGAAGSIINLINTGNVPGALAEMLKYINASGKPLDGLIARRKAEVKLFNTPVATPDKVSNTDNSKIIVAVALIIVFTVLFINF